jgi:hypothetical protein
MRLPMIFATVLAVPIVSAYDQVLYCNDSAGKLGADLASVQRTGTVYRLAGHCCDTYSSLTEACYAACGIQEKY